MPVLINNRDLMIMANIFSGCRIDPKYFPLMFESPVIIESLNHIYILRHNQRLSLEDTQEIKKVFHNYFKFFSAQYNEQSIPKYSKKYLILSLISFTLLLFSGVACIYLPVIFVPLAVVFGISLIACTCLINIKRRPLDLFEIYESSKYELFALKYNLNQLRNSLVDKYQIRTVVDNVDMSLVVSQFENSPMKKKSVSFASKNELNLFFIDSPEMRSRANSYESGGNLHLKK